MPRTKQSPPKATVIKVVNPCTCCGEKEKKPKNFYTSYNPIHKQTKRLHICKNCIEIEFQKYLTKYGDAKLATYYVCKKFDIFFSSKAYEGAYNHSKSSGWSLLASYMKQINSFRNANSYGICFDDSIDFLDRIIISEDEKQLENEKKPRKTKLSLSDEDKINKADIIRLLKYDPFIEEPDDIKAFLYNKLIDFLDEDTLNDSFKLPIVIEIVKGFGQAERINRALSVMDIVNDASCVDDVKKLSSTKTDLLKSILSMAKDNGISENYSNNKSKGAGTLSGMIKELQEKGIRSAEINLYDIETCEGMKQVADISNRSILEQLMLNENDYVDMIKEQRKLIQEYREKAEKFEEESRILKVKLKDLEDYYKNKK